MSVDLKIMLYPPKCYDSEQLQSQAELLILITSAVIFILKLRKRQKRAWSIAQNYTIAKISTQGKFVSGGSLELFWEFWQNINFYSSCKPLLIDQLIFSQRNLKLYLKKQKWRLKARTRKTMLSRLKIGLEIIVVTATAVDKKREKRRLVGHNLYHIQVSKKKYDVDVDT